MDIDDIDIGLRYKTDEEYLNNTSISNEELKQLKSGILII